MRELGEVRVHQDGETTVLAPGMNTPVGTAATFPTPVPEGTGLELAHATLA